ncbi:MAG: hypothetical protein BWK76_17160 [Desulfobulbaceae bacterium A2]|nr:MAG: hypothetical protein BWK76_17160 [Desulfobulbaceae bacterium A2]
MMFVGLLVTLIAKIPVLGGVFDVILMPVLVGCLILRAEGQHRGEALRLSCLFQGFMQYLSPLFVLGFCGLLLYLLIFFIIGAVLFSLYLMGMPGESLGAGSSRMPFNLAVAGVVGVPLVVLATMAFWFAPCLVTLREDTALVSIKLSFRATRKNWAAFLVYGVIWLGLGAMLGLALWTLDMAFGSENDIWVLLGQSLLCFLISIPALAVGVLSVYTSYVDMNSYKHDALAKSLWDG